MQFGYVPVCVPAQHVALSKSSKRSDYNILYQSNTWNIYLIPKIHMYNHNDLDDILKTFEEHYDVLLHSIYIYIYNAYCIITSH